MLYEVITAMHLFIGLGLGAQASLAHYAIFVPITSLVLLIPISFAGLGVREETYRQLFGQVGVPSEIGVALSLLVYFFGNICTGILGGAIYLLRSARSVITSYSIHYTKLYESGSGDTYNCRCDLYRIYFSDKLS